MSRNIRIAACCCDEENQGTATPLDRNPHETEVMKEAVAYDRRLSMRTDVLASLSHLAIAFEHDNERHPHEASKYRSPRDFRQTESSIRQYPDVPGYRGNFLSNCRFSAIVNAVLATEAACASPISATMPMVTGGTKC